MALPAALNDFMDDLSEDWIEEKRSSSTPSSPSQLRSSKRKSVLSERSQNHSNIQANSVQRKTNGLSRRSLSDASSTGSVVGGQYDTTARKSVSVSPPKSRRLENEPEWRRRLLQGEQKDLFSPMAIENIFQKPAPRGSFRKVEQDRKPRALGSFLKSFEQISSSPPPWPQTSAPATSSYSKAPSRFGTVNTGALPALDEEDEESRLSGMQQSPENSLVYEEQPRPSFPQHRDNRITSNGSVVRNDTITSRKVSFGSVRLEPPSRKASDTASWNLTQNSDDFSPVFISKHNTADGRIAYAALDLSKSELEAKLARLRESQQSQSRSVSHSTRFSANTGDESSLARLEFEALPEDLPVGTPEVPSVASIGEFVSIKRGGYSEVGSFKRRPLSPSPLRRPVSASEDESSMLPRHVADLDYSGIPPAVPTPPPATAPKTPHTERVGDMLSPQRAKLNNSPLKLFENHDTFTANRLQRRISQLEDPELDAISEARGSPSRRATGDLSAVDEGSYLDRSVKGPPGVQDIGQRQSSIQQHFGQGDFDDYAFEEQNYSSLGGSEADTDLPSRSVSPDILPPGYQQPFRFHVESPPSDLVDTFKGKRKPSKDSANGQLSITKRSDRSRPALSLLTETRLTSQPSQLSQVSEGKRPLTPSPFKSPTPKRRRTVLHHELTGEEDDVRTSYPHESHASFQNALSRKRKDARHGSERNLAEPDILAQRSILRPRNPTPSQRRREEAERAVHKALAGSSSPHLGAIKEQLAQPPLPGESKESIDTRVIATHLAVFTEDVAQRKKSVTTQDFLDDAMRVMQFIRTQYRPNSGLTSVNEQDSGVHQVAEETMDEVSYQFSLDRPPSREGRPRSAWRTSKAEHVDPRVVSHLRRFQEAEEDEGFLTTSSRATHPTALNEITQHHIETVASDPPGIQLVGQSEEVQQRNRSRTDSNPSDRQFGSAGTEGSKGHSSRTSIDSTLARTTTSRKSASEHVATLAPDAVAHLIPEQIAGMTYDRQLGRWVRSSRKGHEDEAPEAAKVNVSGVTGSDNDPFGDIPDLTVDSLEETRHILLSRSAAKKPIGVPAEGASALLDEFASRPATRDGETQLRLDTEEKQAYLSPPKPTTSPVKKQNQTPPTNPVREQLHSDTFSPDAAQKESEDDDVEHEISILDGRAQPTPPQPPRSVNVSLSSPVWTTRGRTGLSPVLESPAVSIRDYGYRLPQPTPSFKGTTNRQLSVSVRLNGTVTTTASNGKQDLTQLASSSPGKADVTFHLSELPSFTLNQIDEREIPVRTLTKHNTIGPIFHGSEDRYASGNHLLVKALQDAEPEEPYWEDLRAVDLRSKGLTSLHLLDVLCDRLEKADISSNALTQLEGVPHTVRMLSLRNNALTNLTSWSHLFNLQYLDVSFNEVESLEGLAGLVHLRELRADGNQIQRLDGVLDLDGLLKLSLRSNKLNTIDFRGCELQRLECLDLGGNGLTSVRGLDRLPALKELKLDNNKLSSFPQDDKPYLELRSLDLSGNALIAIDVTTSCPKLQYLNLDKNDLTTTAGITQLTYLETLTLRSQSGSCDVSPIFTARQQNLHTLALSENSIPILALPHHWFSLRTLELASCGLHELPADFGLSVPNLRSLNLNFNAIKDLRPLLNIKAMRELYAAGNRLARLRKTMAVLARLRALEICDLRDNPFNLGFHLRAVERRLVPTAMELLADEDSLGATARAEAEKQSLQFKLPPGDKDSDMQYYARLDEGTRLRRRVYEMLLANDCKGLRELDGLSFSAKDVLVRDDIWDRLVLLGVLRRSGEDKNTECWTTAM